MGRAFAAAVAVAALGVVSSLAVNAIPASWAWTRDWVILGPAVGILTVLSAALAARAARASDGTGSSMGPSISTGAGSVVWGTGTGTFVGAVTVGDTTGGVTIVALGGTVTVPVPEPAPAAKPGRLVLGELPGPPPAFQQRPELADLGRLFDAGVVLRSCVR
jgi:hypothetical protein